MCKQEETSPASQAEQTRPAQDSHRVPSLLVPGGLKLEALSAHAGAVPLPASTSPGLRAPGSVCVTLFPWRVSKYPSLLFFQAVHTQLTTIEDQGNPVFFYPLCLGRSLALAGDTSHPSRGSDHSQCHVEGEGPSRFLSGSGRVSVKYYLMLPPGKPLPRPHPQLNTHPLHGRLPHNLVVGMYV